MATDMIITKRFLSVEDGLASREVFCAIQDNDGFMWFGTRNGLNRYDGKNFKLYTRQKNGLAENKIIQLAKDNHNHLFIVYGNPGFARSARSIGVMDLATYKLKSLKETFPGMPFDENYVYWIANGGNDLCFLVANPFQYWRLTSKGFEKMCEMKSWDVPGPGAENFLTVNGGYHTATGPFCRFYKDCALLRLSNGFPQYFCSPETTMTFVSSTDGMLISPEKELINSWGDVYRKLNPEKEKISKGSTHTSGQDELIYFLSGDFPNVLIYRDGGGLFRYDFNSLIKLLDPGELKISSGYGLYSYFLDRQNNIWICTAGGLIKMKLEKNLFTHYFTKEQLKDSSDNQVRGIYDDAEGNVYASVWNKFCHNNRDENSFSRIGMDHVMYGLCRCSNNIYIGEKNIYLFEPGQNESLKKLTDIDIEDMRDIWTLDSLAPGKLLAGTNEGILTFDISTNKLKALTYSSGDIPKAQFVYRFIRRKDKKIWAVAQNGLYLLDENADQITDYFGKASRDKSHRLPFEILLDAYEDEAGVFWFATNGEGLFKWERNKNEQGFKQFNSTDGLPSDILYRIEGDDYGNLWISSDNGLLRFNTKDFKTRTYTTTNGISHNEFNRTSSFKAKDGRLFFGGLNGVNAFYPKDFISDSTVSQTPIHLIAFNKFSAKEDKLVDQTDELLTQNKIVLQPGDRFFNLEFQLLDFEEGKSSYAYMIKGIDKDWNYISENSIRISGLPYGKYTLYVKGQSHNGQWSKSELQIPLEVIAPFYSHWWFIAVALVVIVLIIILFTRWRTRQLETTNAMLESKVGERTMQLQHTLTEKDMLIKEIHHRVKNNLQVISTLLELQSHGLMDERSKAALQESQNRVQSIALIHQRLYEHESFGAINIDEFAHDLYNQVASVFKKENQKVDANFDLHDISFDIDTAVPLGLIMNELLTNSFKYAFGGNRKNEIYIGMKKENGSYELDFRDSGEGLPPGFNFTTARSLGIRLVNLLAKQLNGSAKYFHNGGAQFVINFKAKK